MSIAILDLAAQVPTALHAPLTFIREYDPELSCRADRLAMLVCAELAQAYLHEGVERLVHLAAAAEHAADILGAFRQGWCFGLPAEPFRKLVGELSALMMDLHQQHQAVQHDLDWCMDMAEAEAEVDAEADEQPEAEIIELWPAARQPELAPVPF